MGLKSALAGIGFAAVARSAANAADSLTLLQSKLRLVTRDEANLAEVQQQVLDLARDTRTEFTSVGELYARIARSSTQLGASQAEILRVTKAVSQAIQISGNTATEASAGMIQLAQALASGTLRGDELRSVLEQMPRVAQAIAEGMGTTIGKLRELGAAGKLTSEQVFEALISQSGQLNEEFAKLRPTIGQSITVIANELKIATAEILSATGVTSRLTTALEGAATAIRGITSLVRGVRSFFATLRDEISATADRVAEKFPRIAALLDRTRKVILASTDLGRLLVLSEAAERANDFTRGGGSRRGGRRGAPRVEPIEVEEFNVALRRIELSPYEQVLQDMEDLTKTSTERQLEDFNRIRETLRFQRREDLISQEEFRARLGEAQDELLPEIDIEAIRRLYKPVEAQTTETSEFIKGVWRSTGESIRGTLSDAFYQGEISLKSFVDVLRRALADILSAIITSGIKKALTDQLSSSGSSGSSTAGFFSTLAGFFGLAGGGRFDGTRIVGEDGPELVTGTGRVFNQRQMAFAGAGAPITFAPVTNISIIERDDPERMKREIFESVAIENARQQQEFVRTLERSGVEVKG